MKSTRPRTMLMLILTLLTILLAGPFADRSLAQTKTPTPKPPTPTKTATPFVSHPIYPDQVLYTPAQLVAAYNLKPLLDAGYDGDGQVIALVEADSFVQRDVDAYVKRYHLPKPHIETILAGDQKTKFQAAHDEATGDIEVVLAIAPKATILVYQDAALVNAFQRILKDDRAQAISMSIGVCELVLPDLYYGYMHKILTDIRAKHVSIFVGSGDWGAFGCAAQIDPTTHKPVSTQIAKKLAVSGLASDPSVTAVGGTILHLKNGVYSSEEVWNSRLSLSGATGGGVSNYWPLPDYQKAYLLSDLNAQKYRQMPDVSASADNYGLIVRGQTVEASGTSFSTPLWAAGTLLVNQYLADKLKDSTAVLEAPEMLYQLKTAYKAGQIDKAPFHEVTKGDNKFYLAGPGYNLATGLGTPDFYNIALDIEQLMKQKEN